MNDVLEVQRGYVMGREGDTITISHTRSDHRPKPGTIVTTLYLTPKLARELMDLLYRACSTTEASCLYRYPEPHE